MNQPMNGTPDKVYVSKQAVAQMKRNIIQLQRQVVADAESMQSLERQVLNLQDRLEPAAQLPTVPPPTPPIINKDKPMAPTERSYHGWHVAVVKATAGCCAAVLCLALLAFLRAGYSYISQFFPGTSEVVGENLRYAALTHSVFGAVMILVGMLGLTLCSIALNMIYMRYDDE